MVVAGAICGSGMARSDGDQGRRQNRDSGFSIAMSKGERKQECCQDQNEEHLAKTPQHEEPGREWLAN